MTTRYHGVDERLRGARHMRRELHRGEPPAHKEKRAAATATTATTATGEVAANALRI